MSATVRRAPFPVAGCIFALLIGASVAVNAQVAVVIAALVVGIMALTAPAGAWALAAIVAALTFKGLVSLHLLPTVATFFDMPLAWGALAVGLIKRRGRSPFLRRHLAWLAALALAMLLAWSFNRSEVLRPIVYLALLGEPFAIVGALLLDPPGPRLRLLLERTLLVLVLVQIPLVAIERVKLGRTDHIQGSLYGAGAGAHVISAVILVGAIWILSGGIAERLLGRWRLAVVAALVGIPFLADAKQVVAILPAIVLASRWRGGRLQFVMRAALAVGCVVALFTLVPARGNAEHFISQAAKGHGGKEAALFVVWHAMGNDPASVAFGKGPAETVSRAAFMTVPGFAKSGATFDILGLKPAVIPTEVESAAEQTTGAVDLSSTQTGLSSAIGVFGDLGVFGLLAYGGMLLSLLLRLRDERSAEGVAAASGFAMFLLLGIFFDWWEQPPLGVFIATLAGLSLSQSIGASPAARRWPARVMGETGT